MLEWGGEGGRARRGDMEGAAVRGKATDGEREEDKAVAKLVFRADSHKKCNLKNESE